MNPRRIVIDGKVYNSIEEMPEDVRVKYEAALSSLKDENGNGVPDALENILTDNNRDGVPDVIENTPGAPIFKKAMKILVDGQEFHNLDDLPPEARAKYEQAMSKLDANRNGVPDILENNTNSPIVNTSIKFRVNGKEVSSLDDLPPESRARYEQAMSKLDANHNGVPDFMEAMMNTNASQIQQTTTPLSTDLGIPTSQPISSPMTSNSAITPDTSNGWLLGLLVLGLLFLCAVGAAGGWYFFLR